MLASPPLQVANVLRRFQLPFWGLFLAAIPLSAIAQRTVTYSNGSNNTSNHNTSAPNDPTTLTISSGTATQSGVISGSGEVLKAGGGRLNLTNTNTYTGRTIVNAGTLGVTGGGSITQTSGVILGNAAVHSGRLLVDGSGGGSVTLARQVVVGNFGTGTLEIGNGGLLFNDGGLQAGSEIGSMGTVTVNGAGSLVNLSGTLRIGTQGGGVLNVGQGGVVRAGELNFGLLSGSVGTGAVKGESSRLEIQGPATVGVDGKGALSLASGGVLDQAGVATPFTLGANPGSFGTLNIGTDPASGAGMEGAGVINAGGVTGGNGTAVINFNHTGTNYFFTTNGTVVGAPVVVSGSVAINQWAGTTILLGVNTYTRDTVITGGAFILEGSAVSSAFRVDGGTLGGSGTAGPVELSGGVLAPGGSVGTLSMESLDWNGGVILFELGRDGISSDFLSLEGVLGGNTFGGPLLFTFLDEGWVAGRKYDLIEFGATSLHASDFAFTNSGGFDGSFSMNGNTLQFTLLAVPEPSAIGVLPGIFLFLAAHFSRRIKEAKRSLF